VHKHIGFHQKSRADIPFSQVAEYVIALRLVAARASLDIGIVLNEFDGRIETQGLRYC
jgi:hypothetical protein